jgi:serine/threonine protein kinase
MKFTYRWGQRPLDGYTLKRGLGRGGFGEVYFAVSDGGKEVALKLIRCHSEVELRGIANCLNLKHPNLVHLYDLRADAQGDRWLVMEYVLGEPLSAILQRSPRGLSELQARAWFLQAARAVAYLHDHAIIHRDIKPANLFVENGFVKLGDYGLSKSVGVSQHSQSSNVGTIHYMAPEVASGAYSKQIDIYACGVMLYEMLTGEVPFKGETWGEIAIKHQTDLPDMRKAPEDYVPILAKALNKKAEKRFADMNEMIEAVEAINRPSKSAGDRARQCDTPIPVHRIAPPPQPVALPRNWRNKISELCTSLLLAPLPAIPATAVWALIHGKVQWSALGSVFLAMVSVSWAVLITSKMYEGRSASRPRRLLLGLSGALIGAVVFWLEGWNYPEIWTRDEPLPAGLASYWGDTLRGEPGGLEMLAGYVLFFGFALMIPRWWHTAERRRSDRFTFYPLLASGCWAGILMAFWNAQHQFPSKPPHYLVLSLVGAAAVVQIVSPFTARPPANQRYRKRLGEGRQS